VTPVVLVAHGSADPRAAAATRALARAVPATPAYLDHAGPRPADVLFALQEAGHRTAVVVPLLLTAAYHGRVDLPGLLTRARAEGLRLPVVVTDVLGPVGGRVPAELVAGLRRRLPAGGCDGVVLGAAGTRDAVARGTVALAADRLGTALGVPCRAAYAAGARPTAGDAVAALRAAGAERVVMAAYFLAPGRLYDTAARSAREAGALAVAEPLTDAPELVALVRRRVREAGAVALAA
jgi:sirohydrochlorin ferrochelatase